jgi:hypothetical protein
MRSKGILERLLGKNLILRGNAYRPGADLSGVPVAAVV